MSDQQYDVIIIGAGISGLITGACLSPKYRVLVLEKNPFIGGLCSALKLDDSTWFNVGAHFLPYRFAQAPLVEEIMDDFPDDRARLEDLLVKIPLGLIDRKELLLINSEKQFFARLEEMFPAEKGHLERFIDKFTIIRNELSALIQGDLKCDFSLLQEAEKDMLDAIEELIPSPELKKYISGSVLWPGGHWGFLILYLDMYFQGICGIKGGFQSFANIFADIILNNNGHLITDSEVSRIITEGNSAVACETWNGSIYYGKKIVSSISPQKLYSKLLRENAVCVEYGKRLAKIPVAASAIQVTLVIDGEVTDFPGGYYVILPETYEELRNWYQDTEERIVNEHSVLWVYISDNKMEMCSQGETLIQVIMPIYGDLYSKLPSQEQKKITESMKEKLFEILPSIKERIRYEGNWTPSDYRDFFGNDGGSALAWHLTVPFSKKPRLRCRIIGNLFLNGHWVYFGGLPKIYDTAKTVAKMVETELA